MFHHKRLFLEFNHMNKSILSKPSFVNFLNVALCSVIISYLSEIDRKYQVYLGKSSRAFFKNGEISNRQSIYVELEQF